MGDKTDGDEFDAYNTAKTASDEALKVFKDKVPGAATTEEPVKSSYSKDADGNPVDPCKDLADDMTKCKDEDKKAHDLYATWKADVEAMTAA